LFKGEKSYRWILILVLAAAIYSMVIAFMPWAGYDKHDRLVKVSAYILVGVVIFGILFLMIYMRGHLRPSGSVKVVGEQVLPHKLKYVAEPVGPGREVQPQVKITKLDRWANGSCKQVFVGQLCTSCTHHRRRYYGNFCKHFGMVVDRPSPARDRPDR